MCPQSRPGTTEMALLATYICTDTFHFVPGGTGVQVLFAHCGLVKLFILKVEGELFSKSFIQICFCFDTAGMK